MSSRVCVVRRRYENQHKTKTGTDKKATESVNTSKSRLEV
jgi:hypothetical protein